jgi:hypothetical protein
MEAPLTSSFLIKQEDLPLYDLAKNTTEFGLGAVLNWSQPVCFICRLNVVLRLDSVDFIIIRPTLWQGKWIRVGAHVECINSYYETCTKYYELSSKNWRPDWESDWGSEQSAATATMTMSWRKMLQANVVEKRYRTKLATSRHKPLSKCYYGYKLAKSKNKAKLSIKKINPSILVNDTCKVIYSSDDAKKIRAARAMLCLEYLSLPRELSHVIVLFAYWFL